MPVEGKQKKGSESNVPSAISALHSLPETRSSAHQDTIPESISRECSILSYKVGYQGLTLCNRFCGRYS